MTNLPRTNVIYEPKGSAREYAALALNYFVGCTHGCRYCYAPSALHKKKDSYFAAAFPKKQIIERIKKDAKKLSGFPGVPEILLSFVGDPYQPEEMDLRLTRQVLEILIQNDLPFTILTKGGTRACRDFDLLSGYHRARFGTTLVFSDQSDADHFEPNAATIVDRIEAISIAHAMEIKTWVSLEPVIWPDQALKLIQQLHPIVGHWKVGKINRYNVAGDPNKPAYIDWIGFREEVTDLLRSLGADFYIKKSLTTLK